MLYIHKRKKEKLACLRQDLLGKAKFTTVYGQLPNIHVNFIYAKHFQILRFAMFSELQIRGGILMIIQR